MKISIDNHSFIGEGEANEKKTKAEYKIPKKQKEKEEVLMSNLKTKNGITLIALVITIVVLLLLCKALHNSNYAKLKVMQSCQQKCFKISILETYNFA